MSDNLHRQSDWGESILNVVTTIVSLGWARENAERWPGHRTAQPGISGGKHL